METTKTPIKFAIGDRVQLRYNPGVIGVVTEHRGPIGRDHKILYRLRVQQYPRSLYMELIDDQLEAVEAPEKKLQVKFSSISTPAKKPGTISFRRGMTTRQPRPGSKKPKSTE